MGQSDFDKSMDDLAKSLIKKAEQDATPLPEMTDAFKALTAYYTAKGKQKGKSEPDDSEGSFATFRDDILGQDAEHAGTSPLRNRARGRTDPLPS